MATTLPAATDFTGASQTQGQVKTALTSLRAWCDELQTKGTDIASATTTDIGAATGQYVQVTGTTTITGLGTCQAGIERVVKFTGALTLTYNATSLILPTSANITTAAGDVARFRSLGSGNWQCVGYQRADGTTLSVPSAGSVSVTDPSKSIGYSTGSGGTVTQSTSKSTAVTLNKPSGQITMNNAALAANTAVAFTLNNSVIASADTLSVNIIHSSVASSGSYLLNVQPYAGGAVIALRNMTVGSLSESVAVNFNVIKGSAS